MLVCLLVCVQHIHAEREGEGEGEEEERGREGVRESNYNFRIFFPVYINV